MFKQADVFDRARTSILKPNPKKFSVTYLLPKATGLYCDKRVFWSWDLDLKISCVCLLINIRNIYSMLRTHKHVLESHLQIPNFVSDDSTTETKIWSVSERSFWNEVR